MGQVAVKQMISGAEPAPKPPDFESDAPSEAGELVPKKEKVEKGLGTAELAKAQLYMKSVPAFAQLSLEALEKVCAKLKVVKFRANEVIINKGDLGVAFYMIKSGCVEFTKGEKSTPGGTVGDVPLGQRTEGEFFGEMALLSDDNRATATAIAANAGAECFLLRKRHFDLLLKRSLRDERQKKTGRFRYGEIDFEETGNRVPYLIIPNTDVRRHPLVHSRLSHPFLT
jgi:hypothetical protein